MGIDKYYLIRNSQYLTGEMFVTAYGEGKCFKIDGNRMSIDFGKSKGIKEFAFPEPLLDGRIQWLDREESIKRIDEKRADDGVPVRSNGCDIEEPGCLDRIKRIMERRGIRYFVHYTRVESIPSILKYGLCSVQYMEDHNIPFITNDEQRLDGRRDSISISVSFPNYKNFYLAREREQSEWCVIKLDPNKVVGLDCAYFWTNAANSRCRGIDWKELKVPESFEKMFEGKNRSEQIPDCYTTDPQAEIMVKDFIPVDFIEQIAFNLTSEVDFSHIPCECKYDSRLFSYRNDYLNWKPYN